MKSMDIPITTVQEIFDRAAVGIAQIGLDGAWLRVNQWYCEMLGYSEAELQTKTLRDITHADDFAEVVAGRRKLLEGLICSHSMEKRYIRKDGTIVWGRLHRSLVRDENDQPKYFIAVVEDITEKIQAERALRDRDRQMVLTQQAARLGVWDCDLRTNRITVSGEFARLYGLEADLVSLKRDKWFSLIHPDDQARLAELIRQCIAVTHVWDAEFRVVWPDGSVHWLLGKGTVFLDESGQPARVMGINLDITDRKLAAAALRESEERFRNMADTAPVMIWVAGPDQRATFFNKCCLDFTGQTLEEKVGDGWIASLHPEDRESFLNIFSCSMDARQEFRTVFRLKRADREYRWVLCTGVPRFAPGDVFAGYIGSCVDITDVKRAQEEAVARQKLESLGVLANGIAHDFNNLLGAILASTELALAEQAEGQPVEDVLLRIRTASVRGAEVVRQLMIYGGNENPAFEPLDISALVGELLGLLRVSISKHALVEAELDTTLPAVLANAPQLRQTVMNLVVNASEAIGERDGKIEVSTSRVTVEPDSPLDGGSNLPAGDYVRLVVSDTGSGMTPEVQGRIFDPFFTTKQAGRGLGLAAVQGIIRRHGGTLRVASTAGQGSRFEILLPSTGEPAWGGKEIVTAKPAFAAGSPAGTVLVIEDEAILRTAVSMMLRKKGFSVIEAGDGTTAASLFRVHEFHVDAVLLDVTIPGMSGREILEELRRIRHNVKVILTSAFGRDKVVHLTGEQQAWGYIRKPYQFSELASLLQKACEDHTEQHGDAAD
jgi:PAS domain S-box-containing protein